MQKILALMTVLTLAACATPPVAPKPSQPTATAAPGPVEPEAAAKPDAVTPPKPEPAPAKPRLTSAEVLGQSTTWIKQKLGEPTFVRNEKTASIWQYKNSVCTLNVFLYLEDERASYAKVLHFDARDAQGGNTDREQCLADLRN